MTKPDTIRIDPAHRDLFKWSNVLSGTSILLALFGGIGGLVLCLHTVTATTGSGYFTEDNTTPPVHDRPVGRHNRSEH